MLAAVQAEGDVTAVHVVHQSYSSQMGPKFVLVGDTRGRVSVFDLSGGVLIEFDTGKEERGAQLMRKLCFAWRWHVCNGWKQF